MEQYAGFLMIGTAVGTLAMRLIPARQHDARGLAFLATLFGALVAAESVSVFGAPPIVSWVASVLGSVAAAREVIVHASRGQNSPRDEGSRTSGRPNGYLASRDNHSSKFGLSGPRHPSTTS